MQNIKIEQIVQMSWEDREYPALTPGAIVVPKTNPKFQCNWGEGYSVFCIGSCFAREIEGELQIRHCEVHSLNRFGQLVSFESNKMTALMNEYNAGSIAQRIQWAMDNTDIQDKSVILKNGKYIDLLLNSEKTHEKDWVLKRRELIRDVYNGLIRSDLVILTLGLTEAWFDNETGFWLNRIPPYEQDPSRYSLRILDVEDCVSLLEPELKKLTDNNIKVVLTVSPIPLSITFSGKDPIIANEESKSTLRVAAKRLTENNSMVDYYPAYETVKINGLYSYHDGIHVKLDLVEQIVDGMVKRYKQGQ